MFTFYPRDASDERFMEAEKSKVRNSRNIINFNVFVNAYSRLVKTAHDVVSTM